MMKTSLVINLLKGIFHLLRKIVLDAVFIYWRVLLIDQDHTGFLGGKAQGQIIRLERKIFELYGSAKILQLEMLPKEL